MAKKPIDPKVLAFTNKVQQFVNAMDKIMPMASTTEKGQMIARNVNALEKELHSFRLELGVKTDDLNKTDLK